jgi:FKBP-type peptidyl-prolyl cis-trans isomerase SlyD
MTFVSKQIVTLEYEIKVADGPILESSAQRGPLRFISGTGQLLPALEKRITKLKENQEESGVIPAKEAFGDVSALPLKAIGRREFPPSEKLDAGRIFEAKAPNGEPVRFQVDHTDAENVHVRFLHPLHDKDIAYRVKVLSIEDAARPPAIPAAALGLQDD